MQEIIVDWQIDVVICIDGSSSMNPFIDEFKKNAVSFYQTFMEKMRDEEQYVSKVRSKVIVFRDYGCDDEPMVESKFFTLPDENDAFRNLVTSIEAKGGGGGSENALEAIALALKSDWTTGGRRRRHVILVLSDAAALPLKAEGRVDSPNYPSGMPDDIAQLAAWWEGTDQTLGSAYLPKAGRLVAFVPKCEPWIKMQSWNRYWPAFSKAGEGLGDVDIQSIVDLMVGSF